MCIHTYIHTEYVSVAATIHLRPNIDRALVLRSAGIAYGAATMESLQMHPSLKGPGTFADLLRELLNGWPGTWQGGQL